MRPLRTPKELLPIAFLDDPATGAVRPMLAAEYSLIAMHEAGIRRCLMVVSDNKPELLRYFGDGTELGLTIAYVNQPRPLGLASAVAAAIQWTGGCNVCLALPDSIFEPRGALSAINEALTQLRADVVLAVFPTAHPCELGPVRADGYGRVIEVLEKPARPTVQNTWGAAAWTPKFNVFLRRSVGVSDGISIGVLFHQAVVAGLDVRAVNFPDGNYVDLGTGKNIAVMLFGERIGKNGRKEALVLSAGRSSVGQSSHRSPNRPRASSTG